MSGRSSVGPPMNGRRFSRRNVLQMAEFAAGASLTGGLLAACGGSETPTATAVPVGPSGIVAATKAPSGASTQAAGGTTLAGSPTAASQAQVGGAAPTGSVVLAQATDIHETDPHRELWSDDSSVHFAIFDSLVQRDDQMNLVSVLAESYQNTGPNEWTFRLRQGITFHNGEPLTVETIQWNIEDATAQGKKRDVTWQNFDRVEKVDNATFKLITKKPDPVLPQRLIRFFILPSKYFQEKGEEGFIAAPIGTGPYKFVERKIDDHIKVTAVDNYWRGNASIKDVTFRIIPNTATALQSLKAGEIDLVVSPPPDQFDQLNAGANTKAVSAVSDRIGYCQFFPDSPQGGKELKDKRVRQAINYAVNVDNMIKFLLAGHAVRNPTILPPLTFAFDKNLKPYAYDPDKAKSLLKEAGLESGFTLPVEVPSSFLLAKSVEIGQAIQGDLAKVGIKVELKPTELATMVKERDSKQIAPVYFWSWGSDFLDPEPFYRGILYTTSPYTFYGKPTWDKMIDEAAQTVDQARREQIYKQLQAETYDDPPWLFLYTIENLYALAKNVEMTPRTDERIIVARMKKTGK